MIIKFNFKMGMLLFCFNYVYKNKLSIRIIKYFNFIILLILELLNYYKIILLYLFLYNYNSLLTEKCWYGMYY